MSGIGADTPDPRWIQLAEILTAYSTGVRPGERALITMVEPATFPLVRALHQALVRAGAHVYVEAQSALLERDLLVHGSEEQIGWVSEPGRRAMDWADVYYGIRGAADPSTLEGIASDRIATHRKTLGILSALRTERTRWVLVRVPSEERAMDRFWSSTLRDWAAEARVWARVASRFEGAETLLITGPGTELSLSTAGRKYLLEDGHLNMPGGEVYTSPVEDSAEGTISFGDPLCFAGRTATGVTLRFQRGRVVSFSARTGGDLLESLLSMDEGASGVGEVGVGLNAGMDRITGDPLLDEKILGTAHIALGRSYAACGGRNLSALHWDLVIDLRSGGTVRLDDRVVLRDGVFAKEV